MKHGFTPISAREFIDSCVRKNPDMTREEIADGVDYALAAHKRGETCSCGNPLWVAGSAIAGLACFTCITLEATPDSDYEIDEATTTMLKS